MFQTNGTPVFDVRLNFQSFIINAVFLLLFGRVVLLIILAYSWFCHISLLTRSYDIIYSAPCTHIICKRYLLYLLQILRHSYVTCNLRHLFSSSVACHGLPSIAVSWNSDILNEAHSLLSRSDNTFLKSTVWVVVISRSDYSSFSYIFWKTSTDSYDCIYKVCQSKL